jgi:signal transduction histidine kinase
MIGAYWERRDAKNRLEELLAAKDEFIASVSHEVRTPLTAVLGFAHELDENIGKFSEQERSDLIGLIASQSQEVAYIVDDLLTAARAEAGTIVIAPQVVSIKPLIGEVLSSHSGRVDFSMSAESEIETWADPGRVRQVLRNLLTNADRYGGNIIKMHVVSSREWVKVEVRDNGVGIPRHLREHVFEPYARAHDGATQPASVGLGLSVARKLAQMMDGDLELSREDDWTVFSLTLPPHVAAAPDVQLKQPVVAG